MLDLLYHTIKFFTALMVARFTLWLTTRFCEPIPAFANFGSNVLAAPIASVTAQPAPRSSPAYIQCGLIPFLFDDGYGDQLLLKVWQEHIGTDPWQSKYHIADAIKNSRLWPGTKKLAEDVAYVISRKRNLNEGRAAYIAGVDIHGRKIKGTAEEFDKGIKTLRKLGLNPFRIPGRRNLSRMEADFRKYPTVNVGPNHLPRNRPGVSSAQAEIYHFVKTKLIKIYKSYKPP